MNENPSTITTTQAGLKFGLYSGLALSIYSFLLLELRLEEDILLGILSSVLFIVALHFGMREYKRGNEGYMTLGQGFGIGMLISTITGIITGFAQGLHHYFKPQMIEQAKETFMKEYEKQNVPQEQMDLAIQIMNYLYSPGGLFMASVISYIIMGLLLSLIISLSIRQNPEPFD